MKSTLLKPIYSTTLVAALLTTATPAFAASTEQLVVASTSEDVAVLSLDEAIDKAINSNIDLRMLKLDSDSAYYTTRLTIFNTNAIKIDSISTLNGAKSKYETAADAIRDHLVAESSWKTQENTLRLDVHKAFFDVLAAQEKLEIQKKYIKLQEWARTNSTDAQETLQDLEANYREALTKLNQQMNEIGDKKWKLNDKDLSTIQLLSIEEYKKTAYERRPDMVKASAEKAFAQAKVNYIESYASLSTYPGRIAQNDLEKNELLWQKTQRKTDKEVEENYAKVTRARQAMEENTADEKSAEERYHATYMAFLNGKASASELAKQEEQWLDSSTQSVDSTYQYNVAVASLQYSAGF